MNSNLRTCQTCEDWSQAITLLTNKVVDMTRAIWEEVAETKRENRQTRCVWIAIARKMELFDDDEFKDVFGHED